MKPHILRRILWAAGAVAMAAGVLVAFQAVWALDLTTQRLAAKSRHLDELIRLDRRLQPYVQAQETFARLVDKRPVPLADLVKTAFPSSKPDDVRDLGSDTLAGWTLRKKEVTLSEVSFEKVFFFVQAAENQRPPWRLAKCLLRPSVQTPGTGQAVLTFEALERSQGG